MQTTHYKPRKFNILISHHKVSKENFVQKKAFSNINIHVISKKTIATNIFPFFIHFLRPNNYICMLIANTKGKTYMSGKSKIEICANSVESAIKAQDGGAYRVELCAGIPEGGTTPSFGEIRMARQLLQQTKLHVIIRPRGGDFLYTQLEQEIMLHDIKVARQLGADGVVFGCLTAEGNVDIPAMKRLMNAVGDMSVTFHRAFDMCREPKEALEDIIKLGCHRILTSGLEANAVEGIPMLKQLIEQADGRIIIMPGCGINPNNIIRIAEETGAVEFHFSGRSSHESKMIYRNPKVSMGGTVKIEEYQKDITDPEIVKAAVNELAKKDEQEEALEKKNKELRAKSKKKKNEDDDLD